MRSSFLRAWKATLVDPLAHEERQCAIVGQVSIYAKYTMIVAMSMNAATHRR